MDRQVFENLSEKTGFQMDILEKVYRLTELLKEVVETELRRELVLKGGTAINFVYFDVPRLSVDIDLDYIGSVRKKKMLKDRAALEETLERIFRTLDYTAKKDRTYALQRYNLLYENSAENQDRIQTEINFLKRTTILEPVEKKLEHFFDFEDFKVFTLQVEELFGRKLKALVKRTTARDLYDIYHLLETDIPYDERILRKCFIFSYCLDEDPRNGNSNVLDELTSEDVRRSLIPTFRKGEWVELKEMKKKVNPMLEKFLSFSEEEKDFIENLFEEKKYRPKDLFEKIKFNKSIKDHPGIKWRLEKI
ncbi:hypothetical protein AKJ41_04150 [candidate division MSBL1 archaeon SCGC-AAA259O05]|uniref:Nucleotidyl transferase AbiEii/AbiGii toxin family protein n=1 Tax=candidate division MSBL1 archaeon SCGC-AAA259O05 TaxID=1698271 RepID=A0A133V1J6_9EURY|nr:hypothetical protein AKJ41_04150 [candidate division MSBL1 archaeon SCGC-AAA259O05]